uniref:THAP domain containing 4 n=1 Tax=Pelodiscus sinensis TaxID=13735 RepID=K7FH64_PELSI
RFPLKDSKRLIQWLKAVQRDNWTPTKYSFLCSEHFTKESFSKRLEDQHRLLKPTAVPTIFPFTEKKDENQDYVKSRTEIASQILVRDGDQPREGGCEVVERTSYSDQDFMVMQGSNEMEQVTFQTETGSVTEQGEKVCGQVEEPLRRMFADNLVTKTGLQKKPERPSVDNCCESTVHAESWITDRSGVSIDDFTPPVSGACKFIGSLHSYSFSSKHTREKPSKGDTDANPMSINEVIISASGTCKLIDSLHSYCFSSRQSKSEVCCLREQVEKKNGELKLLRQKINRSDSQVKKLKEKLDELEKINFPYLNSLLSQDCETPQLNPVIEPLSWMLGTWLSDPPGDGDYPTMKPFQYLEEVHISHVGQPMLNFSFNAFHPDTRKPMHRECGFIRLKPDTNKVAFISAQNTGLVEVEEGEVNGQELSIASHSIARISFAKKPHVEQITRTFRLNSDGKLEQTVSMATTTQPMTRHLHITYKKVTP